MQASQYSVVALREVDRGPQFGLDVCPTLLVIQKSFSNIFHKAKFG